MLAYFHMNNRMSHLYFIQDFRKPFHANYHLKICTSICVIGMHSFISFFRKFMFCRYTPDRSGKRLRWSGGADENRLVKNFVTGIPFIIKYISIFLIQIYRIFCSFSNWSSMYLIDRYWTLCTKYIFYLNWISTTETRGIQDAKK